MLQTSEGENAEGTVRRPFALQMLKISSVKQIGERAKRAPCLNRSVGSRRRDDSSGADENVIAKLFDDFLNDLSRPGGVHRNLNGSELGPDHTPHDASDLLVVVSTKNNRHFRKLSKTCVYHAFPPGIVWQPMKLNELISVSADI
jgi:hypothetical protein